MPRTSALWGGPEGIGAKADIGERMSEAGGKADVIAGGSKLPVLAMSRHSDGRAGCAEKPTSPLVDLRELSDFRFLNSQIFTVFVEFLESGIENSSEFGIILTASPVIYSEVSL